MVLSYQLGLNHGKVSGKKTSAYRKRYLILNCWPHEMACSGVCLSALDAGGIQLLKHFSWEDVSTSSAHAMCTSWLLHVFGAISIKNCAGFLLLGYSPVILR